MGPLPHVAAPVLAAASVTDCAAEFVADPFLTRDEGGTWHMLFEVYTPWPVGAGAAPTRGVIGAASSRDLAHWDYRRVVLAEDFHLSYPYVFRRRGEYFMVPESYQAKEVRLYRAVDFPDRWEPVAVLLRGEYLVDSSPFQHDGRWWMFVDASPTPTHDTLRLFLADDLFGPWREHPASPLIQGDPTRARPAGRVLVTDGRILRPAQNCVPEYGSAVRAFEVTELSTERYAEREVEQSPILRGSGQGWNADGMHQLDAQRLADGTWIAAVDGWRSASNDPKVPPG